MADVDCGTITIHAYADRKDETAKDETTKAEIAAIGTTGLDTTDTDSTGKTAYLNWSNISKKVNEGGWIIK